MQMKILKLINLGKDMFLAKALNRRIPLRVKYNITYRCNLRCPFCMFKSIKENGLELDTHQVKKMMDEFKGMGTRFWIFSGGEPFLRDDLGELIDYAKTKSGFHCSITTNGSMLAEKLKQDPRFSRLDLVQVSLDGPREIHDKLRGSGSYDKIILGLEILKKLGIKTIVLVLLNKYNLDNYDFFLKLAAEYQLGIAFQAIGSIPSGEGDDFYPSKKEFRKFMEELIKQKKNNRHIVSSIAYLKMLRDFWPDITHNISCYAGWFSCDVNPQGFVIPCCAKINPEQGCNGLKNGFKQAFASLKDMSKCRDCYYAGAQELNIIWELFPLGMITAYRGFYKKQS